MSSSPSVPIYFETGWAVLSSIGIINILFGIAIISLTNFSPITLVPIVISAASAVANGLCYYAYYTTYPTTNILIAAIFAEIAWLMQEAGLLFYSNLILTQLLYNRNRLIYLSLFWSLMFLLALLRISILTCRAHQILFPSSTLQPLISYLHTGYFSILTLTELLSSYFLLRKLSSAKQSSMIFTNSSTLFSYLMTSTQIRGGIITFIGIGRGIAFLLKTDKGIKAIGWAGETDRFLYLLECLFPIVMFIDIISSKLFVTTQTLSRSRNPSPSPSPGPSPNRLSQEPPSPLPFHSPTLSLSPHNSVSYSHHPHRHHRQPSPDFRLNRNTAPDTDTEAGNVHPHTNYSMEIYDEVDREEDLPPHMRSIGIDAGESGAREAARRNRERDKERDRDREREIRRQGWVGGVERAEYMIPHSQDVVDSSSDVTKSTDFEFLVGRVDAYL